MTKEITTLYEYIKKYIALKIQSHEWHDSKNTLSENQLSIKFKCSRNTTRKALHFFVNNGILVPIKGRGYELSMKYKFFNVNSPFDFLADGENVILDTIKPNKELLNQFNIKSAKEFIFYKKTIVDNDNTILIEYIALNKKVEFESDQEILKKSLSLYLAYYGIVITKSKSNLLLSNNELFLEDSGKLGWNNEYLMCKLNWFNKNDVIAKLIRIDKKEEGKSYIRSDDLF